MDALLTGAGQGAPLSLIQYRRMALNKCCNKPIRYLSFRDRSDLTARLLLPKLVDSTCRVHMRSEVGHWLL